MESQRSTLIFTLLTISLFIDYSHLMSRSERLPSNDITKINSNNRVRTYVVHVKKPKDSEHLSADEIGNWHRSFLPITAESTGEPKLVYSYREAISGFAARLTPEEVEAMASMDGFLHAQPEQHHPVQTTYTHAYLGLSASRRNGGAGTTGFNEQVEPMDYGILHAQPAQEQYCRLKTSKKNDGGGVWPDTSYGQGIIIGVIDSGIFASHDSFRDSGMPGPPPKWRGSCHLIPPERCNNKLIGAVGFYNGTVVTPFDDEGHGTHVAGIAAGAFVSGAQVNDMAPGTAAGMAPLAHIAVYKVCSNRICGDSDILKGIDQAIHDGVDIISISISPRPSIPPQQMYEDPVAIGTLAAVKKKIFACTVAGNCGPWSGTLGHVAPWAFTVGASTVDRRILAMVTLGNRTELYGETAFQPSSYKPQLLRIVYPAGITHEPDQYYCRPGSLDGINVRETIVLCHNGGGGGIANTDKGGVVEAAGGVAMIVMNEQNDGFTTTAESHRKIPVSHVSYHDGLVIKDYAIRSATPTASITFVRTQFLGDRLPSPAVASFSSRGPSSVNGGVLKPDIIAPGVNILAAWPGCNTSTFNFQSGTSMATPHVSGIVALIKNKHPDWSPADIQSTIITSAYTRDLSGNFYIRDEGSDSACYDPASIYARGAGHINPSGALDPGLVYRIDPDYYIGYLCGLGYTDTQMQIVTQIPNFHCTSGLDAEQLNYPSISLTLSPSRPNKVITRTVWNVGEPSSVYVAKIEQPQGVRVTLSANRIQFSDVGQDVRFDITFNATVLLPGGAFTEGKLVWESNARTVASPIVVTFN